MEVQIRIITSRGQAFYNVIWHGVPPEQNDELIAELEHLPEVSWVTRSYGEVSMDISIENQAPLDPILECFRRHKYEVEEPGEEEEEG